MVCSDPVFNFQFTGLGFGEETALLTLHTISSNRAFCTAEEPVAGSGDGDVDLFHAPTVLFCRPEHCTLEAHATASGTR